MLSVVIGPALAWAVMVQGTSATHLSNDILSLLDDIPWV